MNRMNGVWLDRRLFEGCQRNGRILMAEKSRQENGDGLIENW